MQYSVKGPWGRKTPRKKTFLPCWGSVSCDQKISLRAMYTLFIFYLASLPYLPCCHHMHTRKSFLNLVKSD